MTEPREIELKLDISEKRIPALERSALLRKQRRRREYGTLVSVYFDTDKLKLRKNGVLLRVRRTGNQYVQTIKRYANGADIVFDRGEWETPVAGDSPDLHAARGTALEPLLTKKTRRSLKPVFETRVSRTTYEIASKTRHLELSVDRGQIVAGDRSMALSEIELELKRGDPPELFRLASELARKVPVMLNVKSKSERGYGLLAGESSAPVKSVLVELSPEMTAQTAFKTIARACVHQLAANIPAVEAAHPEGLHQARVSLRRLRATISLFAGMLCGKQTEAIKRELKWLTAEFGPARELDIFVKQVIDPIAADNHHLGLRALRKEIDCRREEAFARAQAAVQTKRFRTLVLDIATWIEIGDWARSGKNSTRKLRDRPIADAAVEQLERRWKKLLKRGKRLGALDTLERHKFRIAVKKVRYAADFFAGVFPGRRPGRRRKDFVDNLRELQDCLGELNDIAVHERLSARFAARPDQEQAWNSFAAGVLAGREQARLQGVLALAAKAYDRFRECKPFWH